MKNLIKRIFRVLIIILIIVLNMNTIKANSNFDYGLVVNNKIVRITNAVVNIENINKISIKYPDFLKYNPIGLSNGWNLTDENNELKIKLIDNKDSVSVKNYLNSITFSVINEINKEDLTITLINKSLPIREDNIIHFEFVEAPGITWFEAYALAQNRTYDNLPGYLASISSELEQGQIEELGLRVGWIGGTRAVNKNDNSKVSLSDSSLYTIDIGQCENICPWEWYWVDGPEKGKVFFTAPTEALGGIPNGYVNFKKTGNIFSEPNNSNQAEAYLSLCNINSNQWNDLPNDGDIEGFYVKYSSDYIKEVENSYSKTKIIDYKPSTNIVTSTPNTSNNDIYEKEEIVCEYGSIWNEELGICTVIEENIEIDIIKDSKKEDNNKEDNNKDELEASNNKEDVKDKELIITLIDNETKFSGNNNNTYEDNSNEVVKDTKNYIKKKTINYEKYTFILVIILLVIQKILHLYKFNELKKEYEDD